MSYKIINGISNDKIFSFIVKNSEWIDQIGNSITFWTGEFEMLLAITMLILFYYKA